MRAAPPVQVALARTSGWRAAQAVLFGLAAASLAMWTLGSATACALAGLGASGVAWHLLPGPSGVLAWDGSGWRMAGRSCEVAVAIDIGGWLLLRLSLESGGRPIWLGLGARAAGPSWHAFRCAVYCPRPTPHEADPLDSEPPTASRTPP